MLTTTPPVRRPARIRTWDSLLAGDCCIAVWHLIRDHHRIRNRLHWPLRIRVIQFVMLFDPLLTFYVESERSRASVLSRHLSKPVPADRRPPGTRPTAVSVASHVAEVRSTFVSFLLDGWRELPLRIAQRRVLFLSTREPRNGFEPMSPLYESGVLPVELSGLARQYVNELSSSPIS